MPHERSRFSEGRTLIRDPPDDPVKQDFPPAHAAKTKEFPTARTDPSLPSPSSHKRQFLEEAQRERKTMAETIKNHLRLDVKPPHLGLDIKWAPPISPATSVGSLEEEIFFFQSSRQRKESTWIISFFAVVNVVAFVATMLRNDCPENSHGDCILKSLGRFSFQPLTENPLLGPSSSTLVEMGALERNSAIENHQQWRLVTCIWLHAGVIHLILNLSSLLFVGIRLEQQFGSSRVGVVYLSSAFLGSLASALFVQHSAAVGSSGALFGLIGAMLSALIRYRAIYADKVAALVVMFVVAATNIVLGLLPHVDNFSNIFGFLSGFLLGFVLFYNPLLCGVDQQKGLFDYGIKSSVGFKEKFDKPALRCAALLIFVVM
ncbi:hypothetical protein ACLOJK_033240 [Asimina triloba]